MHIERIDARRDHGIGKPVEAFLGVLIVNADAALDRHRAIRGVFHGAHAFGHEVRHRHQARAKAPRLHPVGWAPDVEIDLGIARVMRQFGGRRQLGRLGPAQLHRNRLLDGIKPQMARRIPMHQRRAGHHFGEQQRIARELTVEEATIFVSPFHHGGHRKFAGQFERNGAAVRDMLHGPLLSWLG